MTRAINRADLKVTPGELLSTRKWNGIVDRLPETEQGFPIPSFTMARSTVRVLNNSGHDGDIGHVFTVDSYSGPTDVADIYEVPSNCELVIKDPVWHTSISNCVILAEPIPAGERGDAVVMGEAIVRISEPTADGEFVMFDPDNPNQVKPASSGFARFHARINSDYVKVVFRDASPFWRYELQEAAQTHPTTTTSKLIDWDGSLFDEQIELTDPTGLLTDLGQVVGNVGTCVNIGNRFVPIDGKCI